MIHGTMVYLPLLNEKSTKCMGNIPVPWILFLTGILFFSEFWDFEHPKMTKKLKWQPSSTGMTWRSCEEGWFDHEQFDVGICRFLRPAVNSLPVVLVRMKLRHFPTILLLPLPVKKEATWAINAESARYIGSFCDQDLVVARNAACETYIPMISYVWSPKLEALNFIFGYFGVGFSLT